MEADVQLVPLRHEVLLAVAAIELDVTLPIRSLLFCQLLKLEDLRRQFRKDWIRHLYDLREHFDLLLNIVNFRSLLFVVTILLLFLFAQFLIAFSGILLVLQLIQRLGVLQSEGVYFLEGFLAHLGGY